MPEPNPGESRSSFVSRCVQYLKHEDPSKSLNACLGKCYGIWRGKKGETGKKEGEKHDKNVDI